jgi:Clp amino terminal domain, pathogenicity island component
MAAMAQRPSPVSGEILRLAETERRRLAHPYLGDEHLLLGVLAHASNPTRRRSADQPDDDLTCPGEGDP